MATLELCRQERDFDVERSGAERHFTGRRAVRVAACLAAAAFAVAACEKVSHENIDKWVDTRKGPSKLEDALRDSSLGADLRAHAAQNLIIALRKDSLVIDILEQMPDGQRQAILAALAPRLWSDARIEGTMDRPSERQALAKDALFFLRRFANEANRSMIDGYLIDWLAGGYYEGRARSGRVYGEVIMRAIGPRAAPKMIDAANAMIAGGFKVGDKLLLGLAATGSPDAVGKLLDMAAANLKDHTLRERILISLYNAYVRPEGFDPAPASALVPYVDRLAKIILDESEPYDIVDIAVNLVAEVGMPKCLGPLVAMISQPHSNPRFRWIGAKRALKCGGLQAVDAVIAAFPASGAYRQIDLEDGLWGPISASEAKAAVADKARKLLTSDSWLGRLTGVELLGKLRIRGSAAADAALVQKLGNDKTTLKGWWGDQSDVPKKKRKRPPTVGQRARKVAKELEELAQSTQN